MSKYVLVDWEINGYDDSDFLCVYYDEEKKSLETYMYGTTRFACPTTYGHDGTTTTIEVGGEKLLMPTRSIVEKAREVLEEHIFQRITVAENMTVLSPDVNSLQVGLRVRLSVDVRNQLYHMVACLACKDNPGKWVNPKNSNDIRTCFTCDGVGEKKGEKKRDDKGKLIWDRLSAGLAGTVIDWKSFGTFFKNGYGRPGRENTSVQFATDAGNVVRATLERLRLDREPMRASKLRERAKELSFDYSFGAVSGRYTWESSNPARKIMEGVPK